MAGELQQLHLLDRDAHQLKAGRHWAAIGQLGWKGGIPLEGGAGFGPAPEGSGSWMELLPVLLAGFLDRLRWHHQALAPQAELRAGFGQEPAQFHPWFGRELRALAAAAIGEQIQFSGASPAPKHQCANPRGAIGPKGG